jgi:hypothetical protein
VPAGLRVDQDDHAKPLRKRFELLESGDELETLVEAVSRVRRFADHAGVALVPAACDDPQVGAAVLGVQPPGFTLGGSEQPPLPLAVPVGLVTEELDPRKRCRVVDVFG